MEEVEEEEETGSRGAVIGKALLAIGLALVVGAGAAYGYYVFSTPKVPANAGQPNATPVSGFIPAPHAQSLAALDQTAGSFICIERG